MGAIPEDSGPNIKKGDAIVLTRDASSSILTVHSGADTGEILVGIVIDLLSTEQDDENVWGVLVNGEFHQILDMEIADVLPGVGA